MSLQDQAAFADAYIANLARIRSRLVRVLIQLFSDPGSWRDADADRFVARAVPFVEGAQRAAATFTDDYLSRVIADQTSTPFRPHGVDYSRVTGSAVRNGVPPDEVYRRPFEQVWRSLGDAERRTRSNVDDVLAVFEEAGRSAERRGVQVELGGGERPDRTADRGVRVELSGPTRERKPLTEAVTAGERRVESLALTDVELTVTHTARERLADEPRYRYFRRVLTGAESCGLCVVASTQRYRKEDLMPIHPRCDCAVAPILGDADPGQVINSARIADDAQPGRQTRSGVAVYDEDGLIDTELLTDDVHDAIREEFGESAFDARRIDYRKILLVREHGELGPTLTVARHKFTKRQVQERDFAARDSRAGRRRSATPSPAPRTGREQLLQRQRELTAEIASLERTFAVLQERRARGENVDRPYSYQRDRLEQLRAELAELRRRLSSGS